MAAGDYKSAGTGTLSASGPGVTPSVTVTDASVAATDLVFITMTSSTEDVKGNFQLYLSSVGAGSFVVKANRGQLPEDVTFNYHAIATV